MRSENNKIKKMINIQKFAYQTLSTLSLKIIVLTKKKQKQRSSKTKKLFKTIDNTNLNKKKFRVREKFRKTYNRK